MRKALQIVLAVGGAVAVLVGLLHVVLGPVVIPGSIPVNATLDSEDRFFGAMFAAYGAALVWCVKDIEGKHKIVFYLVLAIFAGGVARLISVAQAGLPHPFFLVMTAIELLVPPAVWYMQANVARAGRITTEAGGG
jgi:hypothetical protein